MLWLLALAVLVAVVLLVLFLGALTIPPED
jgi:hypothetical protein